MRERSDEQLMKSYADGDMAAFEHLYQRYRGPLYRYVLRLVGDTTACNDLYQGSWEKIIRARGQYKASVPFKAWMYRIAHNHVMDHFRRQRPVSDTPPDSFESPGRGPEEQFLSESRSAGLADAITRLPPEQKQALVFKLESGLDLQTIADVTGVSRETAKSRLRYAVSKLKRTIRE